MVLIYSKKVKSWQKSIGYVPQEIFIADDTILKNVALGVDSKNIDMNSVVRATKQAHIYDFIVNELPEKFETKVGERGIRISGGQRQRIGLARALYFDPKILVLDEATSSLDNRTEKIILKSLANFSNKKTIIMIAHRLTTVKNCDNIFYLDKGNIIAQGNYHQLMKLKEFNYFRRLKFKL